jgi:hypothetical protein
LFRNKTQEENPQMKNKILGLALCLSLVSVPALALEKESTVQALTQDEAAETITISKSPIVLSSKLSEKYSGYKVVINDDYPGTLSFTNATLMNGVPGSVAADKVHVSKAWELTGLLLFPIGILVIGLPVMLAINKKNKASELEAGPFNNQIPSGDLRKGDTMTFNALVPLGQTPQVQLAFKDKVSGLTFSKNSL